MFDLSFGEIMLVAVVAVIFIGPKELPTVLKAAARALAWLRRISREMRSLFDELARESGLTDAQREIEREVKLITGDDGKQYPSYDIADFLNNSPLPTPLPPPAFQGNAGFNKNAQHPCEQDAVTGEGSAKGAGEGIEKC